MNLLGFVIGVVPVQIPVVAFSKHVLTNGIFARVNAHNVRHLGTFGLQIVRDHTKGQKEKCKIQKTALTEFEIC